MKRLRWICAGAIAGIGFTLAVVATAGIARYGTFVSTSNLRQYESQAQMSYMLGVLDTAWVTSDPVHAQGFKVCYRAGVDPNQVFAVIRKYEEEHPELWDLPAAELMLRAVGQAFPCGKGQ